MIDLLGFLAIAAMALVTWRWARRGAVAGYLVGAALSVPVWAGAVYLSTRLDGDQPGGLAAALSDATAQLAGLLVVWLLLASAGVVAGAALRVLHRRFGKKPRLR